MSRDTKLKGLVGLVFQSTGYLVDTSNQFHQVGNYKNYNNL